jgi:hypothetical protein
MKINVVKLAMKLTCPVCGATHDKCSSASMDKGFDIPIRTCVSVSDGKIGTLWGSHVAFREEDGCVDAENRIMCMCCSNEFLVGSVLTEEELQELHKQTNLDGLGLPDSIRVDHP